MEAADKFRQSTLGVQGTAWGRFPGRGTSELAQGRCVTYSCAKKGRKRSWDEGTQGKTRRCLVCLEKRQEAGAEGVRVGEAV